MSKTKCDCANMNGHMCYPCLVKDYYAISADNFRLIHENERLRAEMLGMAADRDGWKNLSKWGWKKIAELESTNG